MASSSSSSSSDGNNKNQASQGPGRGWHGDPKGHAEAGRQSHKNDTNRGQEKKQDK